MPVIQLAGQSLGQIFPIIALLVWIGVPAYAAYARGRLYAAFAGVILSFALPGALILHARLRELKDQGRLIRGTGGADEHRSVGFNLRLLLIMSNLATKNQR